MHLDLFHVLFDYRAAANLDRDPAMSRGADVPRS